MIHKKVNREQDTPEKRMVKLRSNLIMDGQMYNRGSIIDESLLPDHMKTDEHVTLELDPREGKVLLLTDFMYSSAASGTTTHYPVFLEAGETIALEDIPERQREGLVEGENYLSQWTAEDRAKVKAQKVKEFQESVMGSSPVEDVHVGPGGW
jgi:hypothetical protein